ncbi:MAG: type II toxin-antitoxin system PemK/MazF family toxin [Mycobacterium sp.]
MRRGEIWLVDLNPVRGNEAGKRRPAVVVSNDRANAAATAVGGGVVTVVPLTSNVEKVYSFQVLLPAATTGLSADSKAQVEQIRSVAFERMSREVGRVTPTDMALVDDALRLHLDL